MDDGRSDNAMTDARLERDIERALAVDPSPEFLARVRAGIAAEPAPSAWPFAWTWLAGSAAVVITAAFLVFRPATPQPGVRLEPTPLPMVTTTAVPPANPAATPLAPSPLAPRIHVREVTRRRSPSVASATVRTPRGEPEVLIAKDEAAALKHLMRGLRQGVVEPSAAGDAPSGIQAIQPPTPIVVAPMSAMSPIAIEPLGIPARERGVRQ
jgi:hypothetical protein